MKFVGWGTARSWQNLPWVQGTLSGWGAWICEIEARPPTRQKWASRQGNSGCRFPSVSACKEQPQEVDWASETPSIIHALRKSVGSQGYPKGKDRVLISHSLEGESQEPPVVRGYLDDRVSVFQIQQKKQSPGYICARICFDLIILNGRFIRARFRCLRSRMGLRHHPTWGWGNNGCISLTRSELCKPFPQFLSPANSSLRRAEREPCCAEPMWRPCLQIAELSKRIEVYNLIFYPQYLIWHFGDGLPGLGPCGEGLNCLERQAA